MAILSDNIRQFWLLFLFLAAAILIIGVASLLFPPWLQPLTWLISIVVTAVTVFLLREFVPENVRDIIRYHMNYIQKRF